MECGLAGFMRLCDVLDQYSAPVQQAPALRHELASEQHGFQFKKTEKADIIAFMQLFTDTTFIHNPQFANPHIRRSRGKNQTLR